MGQWNVTFAPGATEPALAPRAAIADVALDELAAMHEGSRGGSRPALPPPPPIPAVTYDDQAEGDRGWMTPAVAWMQVTERLVTGA